uniref:FLYWCH-type domain-containing protein n=1 Tax=Ascaris lumbricoides TaxID=6252 RepID=A0A9J2PV81_ASCLU
MSDEAKDEAMGRERKSNEELAARARQAGILVSKSTLFRRFRHEEENQQKRMVENTGKTEESDEQYGSLIVRRISLSRHLKATMLNVYECGLLRQYSLIRGDKETGRQYYRCARCVGWKRKQQDGRIAYLSVLNGKIVGRSGDHHPCCEPLDENKVFAKAVDRQCRLDVRRGQANPRLAHIKGMERMMGASLNACSYFPRWSTVRRAYYRHRKKQRECTASRSPFASFSQEMMKNEGAKVEDREIDASQLSLYGSPKRQKLLTDSDSDTMTHFTVSQRSSVDGIDRRVRKDYEDSADDGEVVLSGTTAEQPSDLLTYEEQACLKPVSDSDDDRSSTRGCRRFVSHHKDERHRQGGERTLYVPYVLKNFQRRNITNVEVSLFHTYLENRYHLRLYMAANCRIRGVLILLFFRLKIFFQSLTTQQLVAELRTMKAALQQHEERIRLLEEQLADRVIVETGESMVYR